MSRLTELCHHEAGHAVAAYVLGARVERVTLAPDDEPQAAGLVQHANLLRGSDYPHDRCRRTRVLVERAAMIALGGVVAEKLYEAQWLYGDRLAAWAPFDLERYAHSPSDLVTIIGYLSRYQPPRVALLAYLAAIEDRARVLLAHPRVWPAVTGLASALLIHEQLDGARARAFIHSFLKP
ncbi:MAG: hypothetical protein U1F68_21090 [Gammaproteobacteria bacterium]